MKASDLNFCPRCGASMQDRFVFGRTRRVCPACGFVFFREPKLAAGALIEHDRKVLLVRRGVNPKQGDWCLPAGYVEYDEGPVVAAMREVREETGLVVRVIDLEGVYHVRADPRGMGVMILYRADIKGGELRTGDDAAELGFFGPDELPRNLAFSSTRRVLYRWQRKQRSI